MAISTAISPSVIASTTGVQVQYSIGEGQTPSDLPQRVAIVGQGATASTYSNTKTQVYSAFEVGSLCGFGSPIHVAAMQILPVNGDGVGTIPVTIFPLDDTETGVAAAGSITPVVGTITPGEYSVIIGGVESQSFVTAADDTVATIIDKMVIAINAVVEMPCIAADGTTVLNLTAKWKGVSGNSVVVSVSGSASLGVTYTIVQPTGGLVDPTVDGALAQLGSTWETMVVNCLTMANTTALATYDTVNDGRRLPTNFYPYIVVTGQNETSVNTAITVPESRKSDYTNVTICQPGSDDMPWVIAARTVARMAKVSDNNYPVAHNGQRLTGITPGLDSEQWTPAQLNAAVSGGCSTTEVIDGVVRIKDLVTFYHPTGDPLPAYRFVVDLIKIYNLEYKTRIAVRQIMPESSPVVPDDQVVTNPAARKPKDLIAAIAAMIDVEAEKAGIVDPATAKSTIVAGINPDNPKRVDLAYRAQLSGNAFQIAVDLNFGFYFGVAPAI